MLPWGEVLAKTRQRDANVAACFVWGSRLFGTAKEGKSDWDIVLVVREPAEGITSCSSGSVDACVMGLKTFRDEVEQHKFRSLACVCAPPACVLKQTPDLLKERLVIKPERVYDAVSRESERDLERIRKCFEKGDVAKGRKIMGHLLRMIELAKQLSVGGRFSDIAAGNELYYAASTSYYTAFDELYAEFGPEVDRLLAELRPTK